MHIRSPDVFVQLQLHAHVQPTLNDPIREFLQIDLIPCRRNEDRPCATLKLIILNDPFREIPIRRISNHEFYLVLILPKPVQVWPMIPLSFAGCRTLNIKDHFCARVDFLCRNIATGLDQNLLAFVAQAFYQIKSFALGQRLAAGDLHQPTTELMHSFDNGVDSEMVAAREGVFAVAPGATHRTAGQSNKRARTPCMR